MSCRSDCSAGSVAITSSSVDYRLETSSIDLGKDMSETEVNFMSDRESVQFNIEVHSTKGIFLVPISGKLNSASVYLMQRALTLSANGTSLTDKLNHMNWGERIGVIIGFIALVVVGLGLICLAIWFANRTVLSKVYKRIDDSSEVEMRVRESESPPDDTPNRIS